MVETNDICHDLNLRILKVFKKSHVLILIVLVVNIHFFCFKYLKPKLNIKSTLIFTIFCKHLERVSIKTMSADTARALTSSKIW